MPKRSLPKRPAAPGRRSARRAGCARSRQTRERILAATLAEASDAGLHKASVASIAARIRAGVEQRSLRPMDEAEIAAQAHFLLGARHFVEQMIEDAGAPDDAAVVDAYLGLVRDGLARRPAGMRAEGSRE